MKILKVFIIAFFISGLAGILLQPAYCEAVKKEEVLEADGTREQIRNIELSIAGDREKIIQETRAINEDKRKLKAAQKSGDKAIADEMAKDIKTREAAIKAIKGGIVSKKDEKNNIVYGRILWSPHRTMDKD